MSLSLSRKVGESILIGPNVVVTVAEIRGTTVRLSVSAPKDVAIHRKEVADAIGTLPAAGSRPKAVT